MCFGKKKKQSPPPVVRKPVEAPSLNDAVVVPRKQVIKFSQNHCNASVDDNQILFVRVDDEVKYKNAKFEVPFSHNAIIIKGGGNIKYCSSGTFNVFESEEEAEDWADGCSVQIIYIPKDAQVPVVWGTQEKAEYRDKASNKVIHVGANGQCDITVTNPEKFMHTIVGAKKEFNLEEFQKRFRVLIANQFKDVFLDVVEEKEITYDRFERNRSLIQELMGQRLGGKFKEEYGLGIKEFQIIAFAISDEDKAAIEAAAAEKELQAREAEAKREREAKEEQNERKAEEKEREAERKAKEALAELERLSDKQWEREKYLHNLELQDRVAYYEVLKVIGAPAAADKKPEELKCPVCGQAYTPADKFCPACGKRVSKEPVVCPDCGHSNAYTATFCGNCGRKLFSNKENK